MKAQGRVSNLLSESQSGPNLFLNGENAVISLGELHSLLCEIDYAVQAVESVIEQLDTGFEDEAVPALVGRLALAHARDCLMAIRPWKDADGRQFWIKDDKITYTNPIAAVIKAHKDRLAKGGS